MILKIFWISNFSFGISISLAKMSALFFYARVFGGIRVNPNRSFKLAWYCIFVLVVAWMLWDVIYEVVQCNPPEKFYRPFLPGHCLDLYRSFLPNAISSVIIDFWILILPLPTLWKLQMGLVKKSQVTIMFFCGYA